jgi:hypothetical protein
MASKIATAYNLAPGATQTWTWNNAVHDLVYTFAAKPLSEGYAAGEKQARIGLVKYYVTPQFDAPSKLRITIEVINTGTTSVDYDLYMTYA